LQAKAKDETKPTLKRPAANFMSFMDKASVHASYKPRYRGSMCARARTRRVAI
jgi:hypothetical protein